jgi:hypothetical protein
MGNSFNFIVYINCVLKRRTNYDDTLVFDKSNLSVCMYICRRARYLFLPLDLAITIVKFRLVSFEYFWEVCKQLVTVPWFKKKSNLWKKTHSLHMFRFMLISKRNAAIKFILFLASKNLNARNWNAQITVTVIARWRMNGITSDVKLFYNFLRNCKNIGGEPWRQLE